MVSYILLSVVLCFFLSLFWFIFIISMHILLDILKGHYQKIDRKNMVLNSFKENRFDFLFVIVEIALVLLISFGFGIAGLRFLSGAKATRVVKSTEGLKAVRGVRAAEGYKAVGSARMARETRAIRGSRVTRETKALESARVARESKPLKELKTLESAKTAKGTKLTKQAKVTKGSEGKIGEAIGEKIGLESGQRTIQGVTKASQGSLDWWSALSLGDRISIVVVIVCLYLIIVNPVLMGCTGEDILNTIWLELQPTFEFQLPW